VLVQTQLGCGLWGPKPPLISWGDARATSSYGDAALAVAWCGLGGTVCGRTCQALQAKSHGLCFPHSKESAHTWDRPGNPVWDGRGRDEAVPVLPWLPLPELLRLRVLQIPQTHARVSRIPATETRGCTRASNTTKILGFLPVSGSDYSEYLGVSVFCWRAALRCFELNSLLCCSLQGTDSQIISFHNILN